MHYYPCAMSERPNRQAAVPLVLAFPPRKQPPAARPMKKHNNNKRKDKSVIWNFKKNQKKSRQIEIWNSSIKKGIYIWYWKLRFFVAPVGLYSVTAFPSKKFDIKDVDVDYRQARVELQTETSTFSKLTKIKSKGNVFS